MKNKFLSLLLAVVMVLTPCLSVSAYTKPGPTIWDMEQRYLAESSNVKSDGTTLTVSGGGYVLYDYFAEIDAERIEILYTEAENAKVTVSPEGSEAQTFALNPAETMVTYTFGTTQRRGDNRLRLDFEGGVKISAIRFHAKHMTSVKPNQDETRFNDNERAIHTAVAVSTVSPVIVVNGARRYVDEENITLKPLAVNGSIYLPIKTLALALGYYHEEMADKDYCLMRWEQETYVWKDGVMTHAHGHDPKTVVDVKPIFAEGTYWLPIRFFAEAIGETVVWRDGIAVIDSRTYANRIINDNTVFNYLKSIITPFMEEATQGNTYYVAQTFNANDENPGTIDAPFRTLEKAGQIAKAGDTVIIREGTYRETLKPQNDGTTVNPITFRAADGEKVTISAAEVIDNFVDNGDGVAIAKIDWDLGLGRNQVFYNNECVIEARYPNTPGIAMSENGEKLSDLFPVRGDFLVLDDDEDTVVSSTLLNQKEKDYWKGAVYVSMHGYGWTLASAVVESSEEGKLHLTNKSARWWYSPKTQNKADWGYISGHINAMDLPGEWVMQSGALMIIPPEGETAETLSVDVKKRQQTIDLRDRKYIRVEGINTIGGTACLTESEMCTLNRMNMKYISHFTWCDDYREGHIEGYTPEATREGKSQLLTGEAGIHLSGTDNRIINSVVDHSAGAGIISTGTYTYIENNIVSNCGYMGNYISGITLYREASKPLTTLNGGEGVYYNTVYNCGRSCFVVQTPESDGRTGEITYRNRIARIPHEAAYNDFHDGILFSLDTGITYEYCTNASTERRMAELHHNMIYYTLPETNPYSMGLYHDGGATGIDTYNNVIFTTEKDVMFTTAYLHNNEVSGMCPVRNNSELNQWVFPEGKDSLMPEHFPYGLPFYAGSKLNAEPFMRNYNEESSNVKYYKAIDANYSEGTELDEFGGVKLTAKGQYIEFKDLDFGETGANSVDIYFRGDRFKSERTIKLGTGDSPETAFYNIKTLAPKAEEVYQITFKREYFDKVTGKTNLYIMLDGAGPLYIEGVVFNMNENYADASHDGAKVFGGAFNRIDKKGATLSRPVYDPQDEPYARDVWGGTILRFQNVVIPEDAKVMYFNAGTTKPYDGETVKFSYSRAGDPSDTYIGEFLTTANGWNTRDDTQYLVLGKEVPAGPVDIYVEFINNGVSQTCNFFSFGFVSEIPAE